MFTVRASSVQATRHVALNRPARAQRAVAMRAGKVRRSRSLARRRRRGSRSREPFDDPRSPDRGLSVARCAREVARGWGARGNARSSFVCASFARARRTARAGRRRAGTKGATAPYPYPPP